MKTLNIIVLTIALFFNLTRIQAQDVMYIHQKTGGTLVLQVDNIDSIVFYAKLPSLSTTIASSYKFNSVTSGGDISSDGGAPIIAKGICWSISHNPTIVDNKTIDGSGMGLFTSNVSGLLMNTIYYARAYATNNIGTAYGNEISFTITTVTDYEGNIYLTVTIGSQTWMTQNLKVTKYNDGTSIPLVTDNTEWGEINAPAYCNINNTTNADTINTYGRLYNWYTVETDKLCPIGWHVPADTAWIILANYLDNGVYSGGKMKEVGTKHWLTPNTAATNESGFTALPGGVRNYYGAFDNFGERGWWWTATEIGHPWVLYRYLSCNTSILSTASQEKGFGMSIRCIRD